MKTLTRYRLWEALNTVWIQYEAFIAGVGIGGFVGFILGVLSMVMILERV